MAETLAPAALPVRLQALGAVRAAFPIVFVALAVHAAISSCDHDEIEHLHAAFLVAQGQRPFIDFVEHHAPAIWFLLAPLTRLFTDDVRALVTCCRWINLGAAALALVAVDRCLPARLRTGFAPLLLLGSWFHLRNSLEVRPDPWMAAFCAIGLCAWLAHLRTNRAREAIVAGICLGIAIVLLQKAAAFAGLLVLGSLLAAIRKHQLGMRLRGIILLVLGAALPLALGFAWLYRAGLWRDFYFWNVTFNRFAYLEAELAVLSPWETLAVALGEQPLLWTFGLFAACATVWRFARAPGFRSARAPEDDAAFICATIALGLLAAFASSSFPFSHNLLMIGPVLALLAAQAIDRLAFPLRRAALFLSMALVAKCLVLCAVYQENRGHREVQDWLLAQSRPGERVFAPPPFNPVFRANASYFWFDVELKQQLLQQLCKTPACIALLERDAATWQENPPALIYLPPEDTSSWPLHWAQIVLRYRHDPERAGVFRLVDKRLVRSDVR